MRRPLQWLVARGHRRVTSCHRLPMLMNGEMTVASPSRWCSSSCCGGHNESTSSASDQSPHHTCSWCGAFAGSSAALRSHIVEEHVMRWHRPARLGAPVQPSAGDHHGATRSKASGGKRSSQLASEAPLARAAAETIDLVARAVLGCNTDDDQLLGLESLPFAVVPTESPSTVAPISGTSATDENASKGGRVHRRALIIVADLSVTTAAASSSGDAAGSEGPRARWAAAMEAVTSELVNLVIEHSQQQENVIVQPWIIAVANDWSLLSDLRDVVAATSSSAAVGFTGVPDATAESIAHLLAALESKVLVPSRPDANEDVGDASSSSACVLLLSGPPDVPTAGGPRQLSSLFETDPFATSPWDHVMMLTRRQGGRSGGPNNDFRVTCYPYGIECDAAADAVAGGFGGDASECAAQRSRFDEMCEASLRQAVRYVASL